jgi:hypothetical protein
MGAPGTGIKPAEQPAAEALLTAFKTIAAAERRKHASVLNYWLSIRGDKEFPPLHDLDPLELSDAGPNSILLELISGGHDAEVRHLGEALTGEAKVERIIDAPNPSILSCIAKKLPIVAISRDFLAFEDEFDGPDGPTHCWVTLLPLSAGGAWVDYVYALVSAEAPQAAKKAAKKAEKQPESVVEVVEDVQQPSEEAPEAPDAPDAPADEEPLELVAEAPAEPPAEELEAEAEPEPEAEPVSAAAAKAAPGFAKLFDSLAGLTGFYGSQPVKVEPVIESPVPADDPHEPEPLADVVEEQPADGLQLAEPKAAKPGKQSEQPTRASEGLLQSKLADVRAKADEARMAKLRANVALYEGLSAAYDFALDAEEAPEEYLRLVEAQGLKIQLRSPMKPVVKLAFDGMCDEPTIKQLEAVLAWAFDEELPRGSLAEHIESAGGIARILSGESKKAA